MSATLRFLRLPKRHGGHPQMEASRCGRKTLSGVLLGLATAIAGCAAAFPTPSPSPPRVSIAGTYDCGIEGQETREVWELAEDGTLVVSAEGLEPQQGTWTMQDGQVVINFSGADNDPFNVEGDRLVFAGPAGPEGTWTCTSSN